MRVSQLLAVTLRDIPAEAEVVSHQLLMRAGFIRRLTSGVYSYLPLMQRVLHKIEAIVRQEMDRAGAQELRMPILQPGELWEESGRLAVYGKELMRLKDRHDRICVLGPTHEEVITSIARSELRSYRQLPMNLYQIQNKYRDEIRPRFGLLRGREFIMKDAYSFHRTVEDLNREYDVMAQTYTRIFDRCGLETVMVRSDSGAIGGSISHEFIVLTNPLPGEQESGENDVFHCTTCGYAANSNRAESILPPANTVGDWAELTELPTPNATSIADLHERFSIRPETILKSLIYIADEKQPVMVLLRGDLEIESVKLQNALTTIGVSANELRMATGEELARLTEGSSKGFIGPVNLPNAEAFTILADTSVLAMERFAVAYNKVDMHLVGANWSVDVPKPTHVADIRLPNAGDGCPDCHAKGVDSKLLKNRGIEVGNIFNLGTKYSAAMGATYTEESGDETRFIMGCYGIGVSRTAASAVEHCHDANGICWPVPIAPYHVIVVPVNVQDTLQRELAEQVYQQLQQAGLEVVLDDRDERAGVKFKDADLIGYPYRMTVGKKAPEGLLEVKVRTASEAEVLPTQAAVDYVISAVKSALAGPVTASPCKVGV
jgi:prolyl-tRNA synthetase